MQEIGGETAVESLLQIGFEGIGTTAFRSALISLGMTGNNLIQPLTIGSSNILHIVHILQPAFYFERYGSCFHQFLQVVYLTKVLQRKQMPALLNGPPVAINQIEWQTAELGTGATVGTSSKAILRGIALAAIAHAKGTMHKDFQFHIRHLLVNLPDFLDREFTGQHYPLESQRTQPRHFLRSAVICLGGSMKRK